MTKDEGMINDEADKARGAAGLSYEVRSDALRHSGLVIPSGFVIRISSFLSLLR